ncbi:Hypothetical_protein [Hexamita inflata]|uniref:Hypothetical_protein n=1 Tax=Hexamita inflata TaxID=28002 RepID=A0AA86NRQ0_9EUKA|nr:Hypothetical protein HINF_LOCUS11240 [Hexamita inflata]
MVFFKKNMKNNKFPKQTIKREQFRTKWWINYFLGFRCVGIFLNSLLQDKLFLIFNLELLLGFRKDKQKQIIYILNTQVLLSKVSMKFCLCRLEEVRAHHSIKQPCTL